MDAQTPAHRLALAFVLTGSHAASTIDAVAAQASAPEPHPMSSPSRATSAAPPAFDERQFRDALAQFATGVTIVCARAAGGRYVGFTANSFNSVSLDPPLVLWSLARRSTSLGIFEAAERYAVNVLSVGQVELARRFSHPHTDRFADVPYRLGWSEAPLIEGCVAWLECRHHAHYAAGDHVLFIGHVVTVERAPGRGLVFQHGRFGSARPLSEG
jgi:flavin reductase (DIM6/NTAB) family NADH-FMN oxidoreductase RutF